MASKLRNLPQVGVLRVKGKISDLHVFEHALSVLCENGMCREQTFYGFAKEVAEKETIAEKRLLETETGNLGDGDKRLC